MSFNDDIFKIEEKIKNINELIECEENQTSKKIRLEELKNKKDKLLKEISTNKTVMHSTLLNDNNQLKMKKNEIINIDKKLKDLQNILNTYNTISFNSNIINHDFLINSNNDDFLTDEEIEKLLKNHLKNSKSMNLKNQIINDTKIKEKMNEKKDSIKCKINEIDENLKMSKEEKNILKKQLVNYISCKETIESVIKSNIYSILVNKNIRHNLINENDLYLGENTWSEIIQIYNYEINYLNPNKCSMGIASDIIDLLENKNKRNNNDYGSNKKEKNSIFSINRTNNSNLSRNSQLNTNFRSTYDSFYKNKSDFFINKENINIFNISQRYTLQNLIQIEINNFIQKSNIINNITLINYFIKDLSKKIIIKLNEFGYYEKSMYINVNNLAIYLSCYLKKMYYESIITIKLKFINKDYKFMKKELNKMKFTLIQDIKNIEDSINNITNKILSEQKELTLLEKEEEDNNNKININNIDKMYLNYLSIDEQNYIKICKKANNLKKAKNIIIKKIEIIEKNYDLKSKEISEINNDIKKIDNEINDINNYLNNLNQEKINYKKIILDKYDAIKRIVEIYKIKYEKSNKNENITFLDNIKNVLKNKYPKSFNLDNIMINIINYTKDNSKNNNSNENSIKYKKSMYGDLLSSRSFIELPKKISKKKTSNDNSIISNEEKNELDYYTSLSFNNDENNNENNSIYTNISIINNDLTRNNRSEISLLKNKISNFSTVKGNGNESNNTKLSSSRIPYPYSKNSSNSILDNIKIKTYDKNFNFIFNRNNNKKNIFISNSSVENLKQTKASYKSLNNSNISENQINNNINYIINYKKKKEIYRNDYKSFHKSKSCMSLENNFSLNNVKIYKNCENKSKNKYNNNNIENNSKQNISYSYFSDSNNNKIITIHSVNSKFFCKANPLLQKTFCYYREYTRNLKKFNPIKDISFLLCKRPYCYKKSTITLCENYECIRIIPSSQLDNIIFPLNIIKNSAINSMMKIIVEINRNYKKYKCLNENWNKNEFILSQKKKYLVLEDDEIEKCCYNKYYSFFMILSDDRKIEFLFSSYEEFKLWINGINFIIKNKKDIMRLINNRNIINN